MLAAPPESARPSVEFVARNALVAVSATCTSLFGGSDGGPIWPGRLRNEPATCTSIFGTM